MAEYERVHQARVDHYWRILQGLFHRFQKLHLYLHILRDNTGTIYIGGLRLIKVHGESMEL
jgi:hypothetical protein